jgi:hypothetical protein
MKPQKQGRNRRGQFEPGVSGNPGGRPRGRPSIVAEMRLLAETEYRKGETFAQRIAKLVIVGAAGGDARMIALAIDRLDGKPTPIPEPREEEEITIVEIQRIEPNPTDPGASFAPPPG